MRETRVDIWLLDVGWPIQSTNAPREATATKRAAPSGDLSRLLSRRKRISSISLSSLIVGPPPDAARKIVAAAFALESPPIANTWSAHAASSATVAGQFAAKLSGLAIGLLCAFRRDRVQRLSLAQVRLARAPPLRREARA